MNNAVYDGSGRVAGYRCRECNNVVPSMWGTTCNQCRANERRHKELTAAVHLLAATLIQATVLSGAPDTKR